MAMRSVLVAMLGVAIAGGSAIGARHYLAATPAMSAGEPGTATELVQVIVASRDIPFGMEIQPQMLKVLAWPKEALPPGAVTDAQMLLPAKGEQPRRTTRTIAQGEIVLASKVSGFGEKVTVVQNLAPNTRAMAIKVDAVTAVGGLVTPGDRVDIVLTQGDSTSMRAVTILQNIRIVGVDQKTDERSEQSAVASTVTVEVTPEQGQALALAQKAGTLSLTLRTLDAEPNRQLDSVALEDILNAPPPTAVDAPAPEPVRTRIKVRRAGEVETVEVN
ncbi:Flp pilus assembly protein CpaB [Cereibacter sphaeroides]|uniref:Flp pilus assembly protein CpaB n=1 Tax=Cereibacter sphaeroides TaxID=1063 RepID=UPI001F2A53A2|nr:Flp pilus assembly protein CpaB [Cereibacter sphaeroides]MCE6960725.1 Flp pilus assembly protein CpaB [Cereibacter sphaeroides]MCE6974397.1 Flp pilus assembly protein CpaB [Cereibacter sphaeroides]